LFASSLVIHFAAWSSGGRSTSTETELKKCWVQLSKWYLVDGTVVTEGVSLCGGAVVSGPMPLGE